MFDGGHAAGWGQRRVDPTEGTQSPQDIHMGIFGRSQQPLSEDEFGQTIADRMKQAGESGKVVYDSEDFCIVVEDEDGELVGQFNLDNVYQEYCSQPSAKREAALAKVVKVALVRHKTIPEDFADAKPDILPAIRSRTTFELMWLEQRAQGTPVGPDLPFFCVGDHLMAITVYDLPEATQTISMEQMELWGVNFYETMEVAKHNLAEVEFSVAKSNDHLYGVMTEDSYDASRLLLLDFVRRLEVQGEPIAMVPHRELLLITGSEDVEGLGIMASLAEKGFDHPRYLTCTALCLDGDDWVTWMPPKDHPHFAKFRLLEVKSLHGTYERQKELLATLHRREGTDQFVATYTVAKDNTGTCVSYAVWSEGTDTLLPKTNKLFLLQDEDLVASGDWDKVQQVFGHLMEETGLYPARYRVREFPSAEQLAAIGNEMKQA
jgi:uncharacterized protein YtpQ (UPF0354 family)